MIGEFGVYLPEGRPVIGSLPSQLEIGDVTTQGLPFYSGILSYDVPIHIESNENDRQFLRAPSFAAACLKVKTSESSSSMIAWEPYETEITQMLQDTNSVQVDAVFTRRNTFGPLHLQPKYQAAYGPDHFITRGEHFTNDYQFIPSGLLAPLEVVTRVEE